jgi:hypothetical protein
MTHRRWRKSSYSLGDDTDCVEVSLSIEDAGIRDSKNTAGPALSITPENWATFVTRMTCAD